MNSASILMNVAPAAATGAQPANSEADPADGFSAALAALQEDPTVQKSAAAEPAAQTPEAEDVSALAIIASLLMQGPAAAANDAADTTESASADEEGAADVAAASSALAAITATSVAKADATPAPSGTEARPSPSQNSALAAQCSAMQPDAQDCIEADAAGAAGADPAASGLPVADKLQLNALAAALPAAVTSGPSAGTAAQSAAAAVHLATTLTHDGATDAAAPMSTTIREPVGSPRWAEQIGSRLVLMSVRGQQEGSLTLTPEHLGPLEVQISVNKDTANVWFGAQHAETRAALADAMPRLRELLAASGISLGQSGVSEQAPRRAAADPTGSRSGNGTNADLGAATEAAAPAWRPLRTGLIDTYA